MRNYGLARRSMIITACVFLLLLLIAVPPADKAYAADPAQPSNVAVHDPSSYDIWSPQVRVTWSGSGSSGYNVYCGSTKINEYTSNSGYCYDSTTTFAKDTTYTYYVRSVGKEDTVYDSGTYTPDVAMFVPDAAPSPEAEVDPNGKSATISWSKKNDLKVNVYSSEATGLSHNPYKNTLLTETPLEPGQTSYTVSSLEYDTEYRYLVSYVNKYGQGSLAEVTFKTPEAPSGGTEPPAPEGGGSESSTDYPAGMQVPAISSLTGTTGLGTASLTAYMTYDYSSTSYGFMIYVGTDLVRTTTNYYLNDYTISIPYKGEVTISVYPYQVYNGVTYIGSGKALTGKSTSIPKNKTYATKISANKAIVRWSGVSGITGYIVYMGSTKVKTVKSSVYKVTISKKGAGKAKYKVIPYIKDGKNIIKGSSSKMKAKANGFSRSISTNVKSYDYGKGQVVLKKISGSGKKYKVTCYAINNRMFKLQKYKKIKITFYADGKKIISKTIKNKKVNVKAYGKKKFTVTVKGKEGDLKHGSVTWSISYTPYWGKGLSSF